MMTGHFSNLFLLSLLSVTAVVGLQVSPNSPCASACLDASGLDPSDSNNSNTNTSDITCADSSYGSATGQKFESCVSCLQDSADFTSTESDQSWFLYNVRYALGTCLFDTVVGTLTSQSCSTPSTCGPLQAAIEDGDFNPGNETEFSYCSEEQNAMLGVTVPQCISCLENAGDEMYLANFLIALQAGCIQRPANGATLGLDGSVFSNERVNITTPGWKPAASSKKSGLPMGAIAGIAVAGAILVVLVAALGFLLYRSKQGRHGMKALKSPLDYRFGAGNISGPNTGSYTDPKASPMAVSIAMSPPPLSTKELEYLGQSSLESNAVEMEPKYPDTWKEAHALQAAVTTQPPIYANANANNTTAALPTHPAYIPTKSAAVTVEQISPYPASIYSKTSPQPPPGRSASRASDRQMVMPSRAPSRTSDRRLLSQVSPSQLSSRMSPRDQELAARMSPRERDLTARLSPNAGTSPIPVSAQTSPHSISGIGRVPSQPLNLNNIHHGRTPSQATPSAAGPAPAAAAPITTTTVATAITTRDKDRAPKTPGAPVVSGPLIEHGARFDFEFTDRARGPPHLLMTHQEPQCQQQQQQQQHQSTLSGTSRSKDWSPADSQKSQDLW